MAAFDLKTIKALFLDMDGVLWSGKEPIGDLETIFTKIRKAGVIPLFGTNNSTRTPREYCEKLAEFGVHVQPEQFFTAGIGTVYKLYQDFPNGARIYVFGSPALKQLLSENGFTLVDQNVDAVLVSLDRELTYEKIAVSMKLINEGAKFYATNTDSTLATENGWQPGGGVMVNAVETCTGIQPVVIGKPNTIMIEMACRHYGLEADQILAVGDRYETDIAGGLNAKSHTALVLTGYETAESITKMNPQPDLICKDLETLVDLFLCQQ